MQTSEVLPTGSSPTLSQSRIISPELEIDLLAIVVLLLVAALAWASRGNLNVDGAAYLDLADRLRQGDWHGFVQGYWSPAYPALLAMVLALTGASGAGAAILAHGVNALIGFAAVLLLWRLARRRADPLFARLALGAFLLCSARTPRLDAVTPDLLLIVVMIGIATELLREDGWRPWVLGLWLGGAFLVKTSTWPWLVVGTPLLLALRWRIERRLAPLLPVAVGVVVLAGGWIAAMSLDADRPTIGGTGELNLCWYLEQCDGRTPDTHRGEHRDYREVLERGAPLARVAVFDGAWTYAPWSDPVAWQAGVERQRVVPPSVSGLLASWALRAGLVFGWWGLHLLLAVVVALGLVTTPRESIRTMLWRPPGGLMLLGLAGTVPFIVVHAEPRLVAPYLMLLSLGWIVWRLDGTRRRGCSVATWLALATALPRGVWHLRDQQLVTANTTLRMSRLLAVHPAAGSPYRVAVIGPALPLMPDLYRARAHVVAQVLEHSPGEVSRWPLEAQRALQAELRRLGATEAWLSRGTDGYGVVGLGRR